MAKYPLFAAVSGQTILDEAFFRARDALNDFLLIYEGTQVDGKVGSGITEYRLDQYSYAIRFKLNNVNEVSRVELHIRKEGEGADLIIAVVEGFNPDSSNDGTLLIERLVPKEFIPEGYTWISIPVGLEGLVRDAYYWLIVKQAGDSANNIRLVGETNQDTLYPVWKRAGDSGAWTAENAIHFRAFSGEIGELVHGIYGDGALTWVEYSGEVVSKVYRYLPDAQGGPGIRDIQTYTWLGEYLKKGVVS
jgi:hypothetical protein